MATTITLILLAVFIYFTIVFAIAWSHKRLDIIDVAWGGGFFVVTLVSLLRGEMGPLQWLTTALVLIWAARLGYSIFKRLRRSSKEDPRYTKMRKKWKRCSALNAYVRIFLVQGLLAIIISTSVIIINLSHIGALSMVTYMGMLVWIGGFLFEAVGDRQLRRHLMDSRYKDSIMTSGLWRFTRHPNYFGEATQWWGIFIIALGVPWGWTGAVSPLVITMLLLFISGVPLTERRFEGRPDWADYKKRTSVFIPWPPRHKS